MSQIGRYFNSSGSGPLIQTLTGNSGGAVPPDFSGNINTLGGLFIDVVGDPVLNTLTWNLTGSIAAQYDTDSGSAVPALNILEILGVNGISTSGSGNTVLIDGSALTTTYYGDIGSAVPSSGVITFDANTNAGSSAIFSATGSTVSLEVTDTSFCTYIGLEAGTPVNAAIIYNTGIGYKALEDVAIGGDYNTAVGALALQTVGTGHDNCALGFEALYAALGDGNIAIGSWSLQQLAGLNADGNIAIGYHSGFNYTTDESFNILIGYAVEGTVGESNVLRIGTATGTGIGEINEVYISGIDGVNVGSTAQVVTMGTAGTVDQLGTAVITAGTGISVTPGANTITIAASGTTSLAYTNVNSSPYVVLVTDNYLSVDSSGGTITVQLPNAATLGSVWIIKDRTGSAATNNITVTTVGGAVNIDGATTFVMNTDYEAIQVIGNGSTYEVF